MELLNEGPRTNYGQDKRRFIFGGVGIRLHRFFAKFYRATSYPLAITWDKGDFWIDLVG